MNPSPTCHPPSLAEALRRATPRIEIRHPILLRLGDGTNLRGTIENISPIGVRVVVGADVASRVHSGLGGDRGTPAREVAIAFLVPGADDDSKVIARCRLVYRDPLSGTRTAMGLAFSSIRPDGRQHLRRFVEDSLIPAGDR